MQYTQTEYEEAFLSQYAMDWAEEDSDENEETFVETFQKIPRKPSQPSSGKKREKDKGWQRRDKRSVQ